MKTEQSIFATLLIMLFYSGAIGQSPAIVWQQSFGGTGDDQATHIQQTNDHGYIIAGFSASTNGDVTGNHGSYDYWVLKLDSNGVMLWQKSFGGTGDDKAMCIEQTADLGYIVGGYSNSNNGDVTGNHGSYDFWIIKLNAGGNLTWQKSFGGSNADYLSSIHQTSDGKYVASGTTLSTNGDVTSNHGFGDDWIIKISADGNNLIWQKSYGSSRYDEASDMKITPDGGFIVIGLTRGNDFDVTGNHGGGPDRADYWILKLSSNGTLEWQKCLGGTGEDWGIAVAVQVTNGYIVTGLSTSNDGDVSGNHGLEDSWTAKLDMNGVIEWQRSIGGTSSDNGDDIITTSDGGYLLTSEPSSLDGDAISSHDAMELSDDLLTKFDASGNIQWQKCYGGTSDDYGPSVVEGYDGKYAIAGFSPSSNGDLNMNHGNYDYWVFKLDPNCNVTAVVTSSNATTFCKGSNAKLTANGINILTYQWQKDWVNLADATNKNYTSKDQAGYVCVVTGSCGSVSSNVTPITVLAQPTSKIKNTSPVNICAGQSTTLNAKTGIGNIYQWQLDNENISGATSSSYVASLGGSYTVVTTNMNGCSKTSKVCLVNITCKQASVPIPEWVSIYPNPSNGIFTISVFVPENEKVEMGIYNVTGNLVKLLDPVIGIGEMVVEVNADDLASGTYFVRAMTSQEVMVRKIEIVR